MGIFKDIGDMFENWFGKQVDLAGQTDLINRLAGMEVEERKRLEKIVKDYSESFRPEDKEFVYLDEYIPATEKVLREKSEETYNSIYDDEKADANSKYQEKLSKVEKKEADYLQDADSKREYYDKQYKDKQDAFNSTASKNGIADSSIKFSKTDDLNDEKEEYIANVMSALKEKLNKTGAEKDKLIEEKENKLTQLDSNFKKDVEQLFNKLMAEEKQKVKDVQNANKETAVKEKEYKAYQDKVVEEKADKMRQNHKEMKEREMLGDFESTEREEEFEKRYKLAKDFYSKFSKKAALEAIQSSDAIKNLLGPKYMKLIGELSK